MESSLLKPFKIALFFILGLVAAVAVVKLFTPLVIERSRLVNERDMLKQDNEYSMNEISEARRKQENFANDPEYAVLVARREGYTFVPADVKYVFNFDTPSGSLGNVITNQMLKSR